jgi:hypothetical protein
MRFFFRNASLQFWETQNYCWRNPIQQRDWIMRVWWRFNISSGKYTEHVCVCACVRFERRRVWCKGERGIVRGGKEEEVQEEEAEALICHILSLMSSWTRTSAVGERKGGGGRHTKAICNFSVHFPSSGTVLFHYCQQSAQRNADLALFTALSMASAVILTSICQTGFHRHMAFSLRSEFVANENQQNAQMIYTYFLNL